MDAVTISPALLALMLAMLTALGYALQRISAARNDADAPLPPAHPCPTCGQALAVGLDRCPLCTTAQLLTTHARTAYGAAMVEPRQPEPSSRLGANRTEPLVAEGIARAGAELEHTMMLKERRDGR